MQEASLDLTVEDIEFVYDVHDTNALNFVTSAGYFSVQVGVCIDPEDDPQLNLPYFELDSEGFAGVGGMAGVGISSMCLEIAFLKKLLGKYEKILLHLPAQVDRTLVDFVVNHLFLGSLVVYGSDVDAALRIRQSRFPQVL